LLLKHFKKLFEPDALSSGENSHHLELATAALLFEVARSDFEQDEASTRRLRAISRRLLTCRPMSWKG